ncbi:MAG: adenylyltransferase/cytidyltransferase family protein [Ichthyobacteriaceae bacterium]|nr:adenylyltransferase/cytidyltransferase family protein [Ichthyobacteriaceae bacterium]
MKKDRIVYTSGTWDLFHIGHVNIIEKSAEYGDKLIVGVSTDELIADYKGMPPVIPFEQRLRIIQSMKGVYKAVKQEKLTDINQLEELGIDVVTIGDDWKDKYLEGLDWMQNQEGKEVVYLPYTGTVSTTSTKRDIIKNSYDIIFSELRREVQNMEEWKLKQS